MTITSVFVISLGILLSSIFWKTNFTIGITYAFKVDLYTIQSKIFFWVFASKIQI